MWDAEDFNPGDTLHWETVRVFFYRQHKPDGSVVEAYWLTNFASSTAGPRSLFRMAKSRWEIENQGFNEAKSRHGLEHLSSSCQQSADRLAPGHAGLDHRTTLPPALSTSWYSSHCVAAPNCFSPCGSIFFVLVLPIPVEAIPDLSSAWRDLTSSKHHHLLSGLSPSGIPTSENSIRSVTARPGYKNPVPLLLFLLSPSKLQKLLLFRRVSCFCRNARIY
jgi:hypothetical protein